MSSSGADPRLTGQEGYLAGAILVRKRYQPYRDDWEHDHCAFCWKKFSDPDDEGYTTTEQDPTGANYHWVCTSCFEDFKQRFGWTVAG